MKVMSEETGDEVKGDDELACESRTLKQIDAERDGRARSNTCGVERLVYTLCIFVLFVSVCLRPDRDSGDLRSLSRCCGIDHSSFVQFLQSMGADDRSKGDGFQTQRRERVLQEQQPCYHIFQFGSDTMPLKKRSRPSFCFVF